MSNSHNGSENIPIDTSSEQNIIHDNITLQHGNLSKIESNTKAQTLQQPEESLKIHSENDTSNIFNFPPNTFQNLSEIKDEEKEKTDKGIELEKNINLEQKYEDKKSLNGEEGEEGKEKLEKKKDKKSGEQNFSDELEIPESDHLKLYDKIDSLIKEIKESNSKQNASNESLMNKIGEEITSNQNLIKNIGDLTQQIKETNSNQNRLINLLTKRMFPETEKTQDIKPETSNDKI